MIKIIWATVTYNPEKIFYKLWGDIITDNSKIKFAIYDNSQNSVLGAFKQANISLKVHSISNNGLGVALNVIGKHAYSCEADWLVYFDQDSFFEQDSFDEINNFLKRLEPEFIEKVASVSFKSSSKNLEYKNNNLKETTLPISSGTAFNVKILNSVGYHPTNIFLDCLDYYFNYKIRKAGYYQYSSNEISGLDHYRLQPLRKIKIFNKELKIFFLRNYSFERRKNTLNLGFRLLFTSLRDLDIIFSLSILKFLISYIVFQGISLILITND